MNLAELNRVAEAMVAPGRGILAADESSATIKKRFDAIGAESTDNNRRDYRELLFRSTEAMSKCISGVILYDDKTGLGSEIIKNPAQLIHTDKDASAVALEQIKRHIDDGRAVVAGVSEPASSENRRRPQTR